MPGGRDAALRLAQQAGVPFHADAASLKAAERDFGGVAWGRCVLVAEPEDGASCARLVGGLAGAGLGCTPRGAGYSQSGQSIPLDTVAVGTRRLDRVGRVDRERREVVVGGGATLRRVLAALSGTGLAPPVLPLNVDMTVGGLLSAGGLGPASHRLGAFAGHVRRLEVVTGTGALVACSPEEQSELFLAVLGGLGQCGVVTEATLALSPAPARMRVLTFLYDDASVWLEDQIAVSDSDVDVQLEGFCWTSARGVRASASGASSFVHWAFGLQLAVNDAEADGSRVRGLLASLRPSRALDAHVAEMGAFVGRYEPRFAGMVQSGAWYGPHPWIELIVPLEHAAEVLFRALELLPPEAGDGHRFLLLDTARAAAGGVFPRGGRAALIAVLPAAVPSTAVSSLLGAAERLTELAVDVGGGRYLSGWLGVNVADYLRAHFGERHRAWLETRRRFDPQGVFRSSLIPQGNRE